MNQCYNSSLTGGDMAVPPDDPPIPPPAAAAAAVAKQSRSSSSSSRARKRTKIDHHPPPPATTTTTTTSSSSSPPPLVLSTAARRRFRITFSLFKFHSSAAAPSSSSAGLARSASSSSSFSSSTDWFKQRFNQLLHGELKPDTRAYLVLAYFMYTHRIPTTTTTTTSPASSSSLALLPRLVNLPRSAVPQLSPAARDQLLFTGSITFCYAPSSPPAAISCTLGLQHKLGYAEHGTNLPFATAVGADGPPFLPWGGDVVSAICGDDSQVLAYVRDAAYAIQAEEKLTGFSSIRKIHLPHRPMLLCSASSSASAPPLECLVSCFVTCEVSTGKTDARFDVYEQQQSPPTTTPLLRLPDLELAPWPAATSTGNAEEDDAWIKALVQWAKREPPSSSS